MADSCATCFFYRGGACHLNAPFERGFAAVEPGDWCGEGSDAGTGVAFANAINSLAGPVGPQGPAGPTGATGTGIASSGSFTFTASPLTIADVNVAVGSKFLFQPTNNAACLLIASIGGTNPGQNGGPFVSSRNAGVDFTVTGSQFGGGGPNGTETFDYFIFN